MASVKIIAAGGNKGTAAVPVAPGTMILNAGSTLFGYVGGGGGYSYISHAGTCTVGRYVNTGGGGAGWIGGNGGYRSGTGGNATSMGDPATGYGTNFIGGSTYGGGGSGINGGAKYIYQYTCTMYVQ